MPDRPRAPNHQPLNPPKNCETVPRSILFRILAFSYSGALHHHTVQPMQCIQRNQNYLSDKRTVIASLARFRETKSEELAFATISGAAAIGVFSWPSTERTIFIAKMLWNWSLFLSFFALISSAHQRLLRLLPSDQSDDFSDADLARCLSLFLQPPVPEPPGQGGKKGVVHREVSRRMVWFWQCPTMLMSFSWVFFLMGYTLHLLTPVFDVSLAELTTVPAIVTVCGCAVVVANFFFCAELCQRRISKASRGFDEATPRRPTV
ncbi:hypothetical protein QBC41DRAFT_280517 [Cercophora samala]|uniref:Uncharacterized protein n=1 Tax=Cercophora samala TaxID=330535 RepID=A0AA39Z986_9PEZI|nr:hypothetical protein QBC41DRAFT_280517 [Cercophora samala]